MSPPYERQVGGGPTIYCDFCNLPAAYVWLNTDPGIVDANLDVNPYWPIEVDPITPTCHKCEALIDANKLVELLERSLDEWIIAFGGEPNREGWREQAQQTQAARLAAWLHRRDTAGEIPLGGR